MGYSLRKADARPTPARPRSSTTRRCASSRKHRGALEYSGELYLMTGNLPKAEERLAALDKACFLPCEEYSDLKNGGRSLQGERQQVRRRVTVADVTTRCGMRRQLRPLRPVDRGMLAFASGADTGIATIAPGEDR